MAYSQAQKEATRRYFQKNYHVTSLRIPIELKDIVKSEAGEKSQHSYLLGLLYDDLEKKGYTFERKSE